MRRTKPHRNTFSVLCRSGQATPGVLYQIASVELASGQVDQARRDLEALIKTEPKFLEAHVSLATVYFRQKRKLEGERERAIVAKLNAERQTINEVGAKAP